MSFSLSVLDLAPIRSNATSTEAFQHMVDLAQLADRLGYARFWLAEHHGMPGIASSSPEVLIAHVAAATAKIRVGAGGVMLPNHAPLRVAEAFHTLQALHPDRIDLGLGRAPGTDPATSRALRPFDAAQFPAQLDELMALSSRSFPEDHQFHKVRVIPDDVTLPPIWILGSSGASAQLAGMLGLGYSFASHFSATSPLPAIRTYRSAFQPSEAFPKPHMILALGVTCAETDEEAEHLARTMDLVWVKLHRGESGRIPSPEEAIAYPYTDAERVIVSAKRALHYAGSPKTLVPRIRRLVKDTGADEIMISSTIYDPKARLKSFELLAKALL